ncbi:MAG TPA: aldehyde dehydrogenase family protein, partial [Steroidobacteraceae bacterium]
MDVRARARTADAAGTELVQHWISGRLTSGSDGGRLLDVFNPATGAVTARVIAATTGDVATAVASAAAAFPAWADTPPVRRARILNRYLSLLNEHRDAIAKIITSEHGKVFSDAQGEVTRGIEIVEFACGIAQLLKGDFTDQV